MIGIITLTTDFGLTDEYVGVMKGVILTLAPAAQVIDLSHGIEPQNIAQAAYLINSGCRYFPDNTIHMVVVDPGVGSNRRLILVQARRQLFLAPDNGVLSLLLNREDFNAAHLVANEELFSKPMSKTFHGRDILAPVAAHIANGIALDKVGPQLKYEELQHLDLGATITPDGKSVQGLVIQVDRFGNLITNIDRRTTRQLTDNNTGAKLTVLIGERVINTLADCYDDAPRGGLLSLFGSRDYLEIAVNHGQADKYLGVAVGDVVQLRTDKIISLHKQE